MALLAVPGGPRMNRFSPPTRQIPSKSIISSFPTNDDLSGPSTSVVSCRARLSWTSEFNGLLFMLFEVLQETGTQFRIRSNRFSGSAADPLVGQAVEIL